MGNTSSASSTQLPSCWWPARGQLKNEHKVTWWNCRQDMPEPNKGSLPDLSRKEPCTPQRTAWLMFKGSRRDVGEVTSDSTAGSMSIVTNALMIGQLSQPNPTPHPNPTHTPVHTCFMVDGSHEEFLGYFLPLWLPGLTAQGPTQTPQSK